MAKLPESPPNSTLERISPAVATLQAGTKLWRINFRDGIYPTTWDRMRYYGPVRSARFDHHLDPPGVQDRGILYAAAGDDAIATCLAEVFQDIRLVDTRRNEPRLAAFTLVEDVPLLDLSGKWPTVAGPRRTSTLDRDPDAGAGRGRSMMPTQSSWACTTPPQ